MLSTCKLQLGVYICDNRGQSKLFNKQTRHNYKFLGSCELKAPLWQHKYYIGGLSSQHVDQASLEIIKNNKRY